MMYTMRKSKHGFILLHPSSFSPNRGASNQRKIWKIKNWAKWNQYRVFGFRRDPRVLRRNGEVGGTIVVRALLAERFTVEVLRCSQPTSMGEAVLRRWWRWVEPWTVVWKRWRTAPDLRLSEMSEFAFGVVLELLWSGGNVLSWWWNSQQKIEEGESQVGKL